LIPLSLRNSGLEAMSHASQMWLVGAIAVLMSACSSTSGPPKKVCYPVKGQVFVGAKPAEGAMVILHPQDGPTEEWASGYPRAQVQSDGSFELETYGDKDGAPAGNYKVLVTWTGGLNSEETEDTQMVDRLKGRYSDPARSTLQAKVDAAPTELPPIKLQ
jgi:hypothetical protein